MPEGIPMYGNGQAPIFILKDGTQRTRGRTAQSNNIAAAKAVADAVRSTLGPKGMDKMLVDSMGDVVITNDGATILKEMDIEHPAAKMIIEVAKTQEQHCFDGTTSAVILSGELLKRSEDLIEQNVHPTVICEGFRLAAERAIGLMEGHGISTENDDGVLQEVAKTALTGKSAGAVKSFMADICVRAVNAVGVIEDDERLVDLSDIKVEKRQGGSIKDSSLIDGIHLDKERVHAGMPRSVSDAKIALVNSAIEVKKTEVDAKIQITDPNQLALSPKHKSNIAGTTSAVILSGELLKRSEDLIEQNVHPTVICEGFRLAAERAIGLMEGHGISTENDDGVLQEVAKTALTGKSAGAVKSFMADICVRAVNAVGVIEDDERLVDLSDIKVEKRQGGSIKDSSLIDGILLDKERVHAGMPRSVSDAKIALVNSAIEVKKTEVDAKIQITDPNQLALFLEEEENYIRNLVNTIENAGANVLICQKGIDELAQHYLSKKGIFAIRRAKKSDMEALAKATGGTIITNLEDMSGDDLGAASRVEEKKIGDSDMTFITGCPEAKSVSVLLRGGTEHVVDEIRRAFDDAVGVVSVAWEDGAVLTGGGSVLAAVSRDLRTYAETVGGREQMAIEAFASALEIIPRTLAENAGLDPVTTLIELRKAHADGQTHAGINVYEGGVVDMKEANVVEPLRVVEQAIQSATETAIMILRIDDVISSKGVPMDEGMGDMGDFHM